MTKDEETVFDQAEQSGKDTQLYAVLKGAHEGTKHALTGIVLKAGDMHMLSPSQAGRAIFKKVDTITVPEGKPQDTADKKTNKEGSK